MQTRLDQRKDGLKGTKPIKLPKAGQSAPHQSNTKASGDYKSLTVQLIRLATGTPTKTTNFILDGQKGTKPEKSIRVG